MSAPEHPPFSIVGGDHDRRFELRGELDMASAGEVTDAVAGLGSGDLTFDLSELTFIDSSGVRALLAVATGLEHGHLILERPTPAVRRVFEIVGLADASAAIVVHDGDVSAI